MGVGLDILRFIVLAEFFYGDFVLLLLSQHGRGNTVLEGWRRRPKFYSLRCSPFRVKPLWILPTALKYWKS